MLEGSDTCIRCGTPASEKVEPTTRYMSGLEDEGSLLSFAPGDSFGPRYQIVEEIGRGGMGRVFKARDKELDIVVALKMIHPELMSNPRTVERFKKELLLAREISHDNVVRIHDFGEIKGIKFISMQYIDGENLGELIQTSGPLSVQASINISKQICLGLKAAHKQGIIHRDLKPQNIMVDKSGKVYITDFGLAKSLENHSITLSGTVIGTPQYVSPEQAKGESLDKRSDIYSLGIIMYEMMTGKEIFVSETVIGYLQKHIQQKPDYPSSINPMIPPFLEKIILRCLEKNQEKRYQDIDEVLKYLAEERASSGVFYFRPRTLKILKVSLAAFFFILAALGLYLLFVKREAALPVLPGKLSIAIFPFEFKTGAGDMGLWEGAMQNLLILDLKQSPFIRVLSETRVHHILEELRQLAIFFYSFDVLKLVSSRGKFDYILFHHILNGLGRLRINWNSPGLLKQVASSGKLDYIIQGKISEAKGGLGVIVDIFEIKSEKHLEPTSLAGVMEKDFFSLVDRMTLKIKDQFNLSAGELSRDVDQKIEDLVGTVPQAYKYCWQGEKLHREEKYEESTRVLKEAVKIDPQFAVAYAWIANNNIYRGDHKEADENMEKALYLIDKGKAPERDRHLVKAFASSLFYNSPEDAVNIYHQILRKYPDDELAKVRLGAIYRNQEEWQEAEKQFKDILTNDDRSQIACVNLAYIYKASSRYDKALKLLQDYQHLFHGDETYHYYLSRIHLYQGNYNLALAEIEKLLRLNPFDSSNINLLGCYHHIKGDFDQAERLYRQIAEKEGKHEKTLGKCRLGSLYLLRGQYKKCEKEVMLGIRYSRGGSLLTDEAKFYLLLAYLNLRFNKPDKALETIDTVWEAASSMVMRQSADSIKAVALYFKGRAYLQMKKIKEAEDTAHELEKLIERSGSKRKRRLHFLLRGFIALEDGRSSEGLFMIKQVYKLCPYHVGNFEDRSFYLDSLAEAYCRLNRTEEAKKRYQEITHLTLGRIMWGDIYARSFYQLGKIFQQNGMKEDAINYYEKFLSLWRDGDPHLPETRDAKERLAALKKLNR